MDAVYLYGAGIAGDGELRYSLRSLTNLPQVDRVVVAGAHPAWLAGDVLRVVPDTHRPGKHFDTWANLRAAVNDRRVSDEFVLMNDDFFVVDRVDVVPVWQRGVLSRWEVRTATQDKRRDHTISMLEKLEIDGRLSYELHAPMVMHRRLMADLMARAEDCLPSGSEPPWKRSLYGNAAHPGVGELRDDVKIYDFTSVPQAGQEFVSTSDYTWRRGAVGEWLRARFVEPCRHEREG